MAEITLSLCHKCGARDPVVTAAIEMLRRELPDLVLDPQDCLFSCDLPAVLVKNRQFIARGTAEEFAARIRTWLEAQK